MAKQGAKSNKSSKIKKTGQTLLPSQEKPEGQPQLERMALFECQRGNPLPLLKLLEPLQRPVLAFYICATLKNGWKPPKKLGRCDAIAYHYDLLLATHRGEGKLIRPKLMKHYNMQSEKTLCNYHHSWRNKVKAAIARVEAVTHTSQDFDLLRQLSPDYLRAYSPLISMFFET